MPWDGLNDEQRDHVRALNKIPPERRCASGWHVLDDPCDKCNCNAAYGFASLADAMLAAREEADDDPE